MDAESLRYAGFWPRLSAMLLDIVIMLPLAAISLWGFNRYRFFMWYYVLPDTLFCLFYSVYLVRRFGGTPGKLLMGIQIRKLSGEPVGYRQAFLRFFPELLLRLLWSVAMACSMFRISDAEFQSLTFVERSTRVAALMPAWYLPFEWTERAWVWSELIVLLTNHKRRALHDFIAGTVVIHKPPIKPMQRTGASAPVADL